MALLLVRTASGQAIPDTTTRPRALFVEVGGLAATSQQTPFWLRSRQYGTIPLDNPAGLVRLGGVLNRDLTSQPQGLRLKLGAEMVGQTSPSGTRVLLPEAYSQLRLGRFELYAGRRREVFGLVDTLLSSGSYAWSGNALPLPKVQLGTAGFVPLGFTRGVVAIKALYAHGWFGRADSVQGSFLHQKALFARLSLLKHRLRVYAGATHYAQWGGRRRAGTLAKDGTLPGSLSDYWQVIRAAEPPAADSAKYVEIDRLNRVGNHLGSIDVALEWLGERSQWLAYYQHPFEDKSGVAFQNLPDGLYGIRWKTNRPAASSFQFRQLTLELLLTTDQSGFDIKTGSRLYDGADDYFNNYQYSDGWTYRQRVVGTPFLTRTVDARPELRDVKGGFGPIMISNNRVEVLHVGLLGGWPSGTQIRALLSVGQNDGRPIQSDPRLPKNQFSGLIAATVPVNWLGKASLNLSLALDQGGWLPTSVGGAASLRVNI